MKAAQQLIQQGREEAKKSVEKIMQSKGLDQKTINDILKFSEEIN